MSGCWETECSWNGTQLSQTAKIGLAVGLGGLWFILILTCTLTLALLVWHRKSNRTLHIDAPTAPHKQEMAPLHYIPSTYKFQPETTTTTFTGGNTSQAPQESSNIPNSRSTRGTGQSKLEGRDSNRLRSFSRVNKPSDLHIIKQTDDDMMTTESACPTITLNNNSISNRPPLQPPSPQDIDSGFPNIGYRPCTLSMLSALDGTPSPTPITAIRDYTAYGRMLIAQTDTEKPPLMVESGEYVNEGMGP